jgi:hypothetical protein
MVTCWKKWNWPIRRWHPLRLKDFHWTKKSETKKVSQWGGLLQVPLLNLAKVGLPLVINFGSCTWPPFMANLARIKQVHARSADLVKQVLHHAGQTQKARIKQAGPCQVSRSIKASLAPWSAATQCQELIGLCQVSRSIKASHAPWSADKQCQELIGLCQVSRSIKASHAPWSADTQCQELIGLCQVSRSIKASHAPWSADTQCQELIGLCQVSRSIKASHSAWSADTQGQELTGISQVSRSIKSSLHHAQQLNKVRSYQDYARSADPLNQVCTMISSYTRSGSNMTMPGQQIHQSNSVPWSAAKQGQELTGLCEVSRSIKANHAPWSADTQGQELPGLCQVSRSFKASQAPWSAATLG